MKFSGRISMDTMYIGSKRFFTTVFTAYSLIVFFKKCIEQTLLRYWMKLQSDTFCYNWKERYKQHKFMEMFSTTLCTAQWKSIFFHPLWWRTSYTTCLALPWLPNFKLLSDQVISNKEGGVGAIILQVVYPVWRYIFSSIWMMSQRVAWGLSLMFIPLLTGMRSSKSFQLPFVQASMMRRSLSLYE